MTGRALKARLERVRRVFAANFEQRDELGASVSIWSEGEEVLALSSGFKEREKLRVWDDATPVPFWSATKGLAAATTLLLLEENGISPEQPLADLWPEFARAGKSAVTIAHVMSHQAGLPALDRDVSIYDHADVISALCDQQPLWSPGDKHGYHPRLFGFLLGEMVRRMSDGKPLGEVFRERIAAPLDLELWIGLPESEHARVATLYPGKMSDPDGEAEFYRAFGDPESLTRRSFGSPAGLAAISGMNDPQAWQAGWPAMGGIGTARGLAKFYAVLAAGGEWNGQRYFSEQVIHQMETLQVAGQDEVFCLETAFSLGFMKDSPTGARNLFGNSSRAFGHPGAGGSQAFADPEHQLSFAYVMNQMNYGVLPGRKALDMVDALYG